MPYLQLQRLCNSNSNAAEKRYDIKSLLCRNFFVPLQSEKIKVQQQRYDNDK